MESFTVSNRVLRWASVKPWIKNFVSLLEYQDYFPNGGKSQPGCGISIDIFNIGFGKRKRSLPELPRILGLSSIDPGKIGFIYGINYILKLLLVCRLVEIAGCSHFRVVYFYAESIRNNCEFKSVPCDTFG